jgi:hypothetical protein
MIVTPDVRIDAFRTPRIRTDFERAREKACDVRSRNVYHTGCTAGTPASSDVDRRTSVGQKILTRRHEDTKEHKGKAGNSDKAGNHKGCPYRCTTGAGVDGLAFCCTLTADS